MPAPFTLNGFQRGFRDGLALGVSIFAYGLAFGLVAAQAAITLIQALLMSAGVYSGSAQLAAVNLMQAGQVTVASLAATILLINARYILFGAALQPWLSQVGGWRALGSLLLLGDANWILVMRGINDGEQDRAYLMGTGAPMFLGWMLGTGLGAVSAGILPDPKALGFDMMLPAFAAAMMAAMMKSRASLVPVAAGAGAALAVFQMAGAGWAVIAAGLAGAVVAALTYRPAEA